MKFGVNLLNFGPGASPESLLRWTTFAETLGYHMVMISDHIAVTPDVGGRYPAPLYDPYTTLAWLAGQTSTIELGTTVIVVPYRSPILMARLGANIDQMSNGRFIFGIGVGWAQQEFAALNVNFEKRGPITDEYLAAIKTLWTNELASFSGEYVSFEDVRATPMPVQSPHPPIWIGGASPAAFRRTVEYGDGWHPIRLRADWMRDVGVPKLKEMADRMGKPVPAICPRIKLRLTDNPVPDDDRVAGVGTVDQVRGDLEILQELGAEYVLFDTYADDPAETATHEWAWSMYMTVAEEIVDLSRQELR
ncbi:MAG: TIGR03619 family F420-dependent LLM class oxidoreductase [Chloroflexi bacterium]|nr:TIGR03619 family F420-dependent LLM class oxidoreductase [Chloroflexota bacterium]